MKSILSAIFGVLLLSACGGGNSGTDFSIVGKNCDGVPPCPTGKQFEDASQGKCGCVDKKAEAKCGIKGMGVCPEGEFCKVSGGERCPPPAECESAITYQCTSKLSKDATCTKDEECASGVCGGACKISDAIPTPACTCQ